MMRFKEDMDIMEFLMAVKECVGGVYFETTEGDCLALRSALSQYIFCAATNERELLMSGSIRCENPEDYRVLEDYLQG